MEHDPASNHALNEETRADARIVLRLPADLDIATVEAIHDAIIDAVDHAVGEIVLDLDGVRFLDSYGIRLLVTARRRAWDRDLPFRLHGGKPLIRDLLELVGQDPLYQPKMPRQEQLALGPRDACGTSATGPR